MPDRVKKVSYCYPSFPTARVRARASSARSRAPASTCSPTPASPPGAAGRSSTSSSRTSARCAASPPERVAVEQDQEGVPRPGDRSGGAVHRHLQKLADAGINVTAADAVAAGQGR